MRPMHKILAAAKPHLLPAHAPVVDYKKKETAICYALGIAAGAGDITREEARAGGDCIIAKMHEQEGDDEEYPAAFLLTLARRKSWVPDDSTADSPMYIAFRDKWLDELIEEQRRAA